MKAEGWGDLKDMLVELARQVGFRERGSMPSMMEIHFPDGDWLKIPLGKQTPARAAVRDPPRVHRGPGEGERLEPSWASGPEPKCYSDCQRVYWPGLGEFRFTPKQRPAVQLLWEAYEDGATEVLQTTLLTAAESDASRLRDLFARSQAWGTLIIQGETPGSYRLAPLPDEGMEDEE